MLGKNFLNNEDILTYRLYWLQCVMKQLILYLNLHAGKIRIINTLFRQADFTISKIISYHRCQSMTLSEFTIEWKMHSDYLWEYILFVGISSIIPLPTNGTIAINSTTISLYVLQIKEDGFYIQPNLVCIMSVYISN